MLERLHFVLGGCVGEGTQDSDCIVALDQHGKSLLLLLLLLLSYKEYNMNKQTTQCIASCLRLMIIPVVLCHICLVFPDNYSSFLVNNSCVFDGWRGRLSMLHICAHVRLIRRMSMAVTAVTPGCPLRSSHHWWPHAANHYSDTLPRTKETTILLRNRFDGRRPLETSRAPAALTERATTPTGTATGAVVQL